MKFTNARPYADPEAAARKLIEIANAVEAVQDGRIHIELINGPMFFEHKATPANRAGMVEARPIRDLREVHASRSGVICVKGGHQLRRPERSK